MPRIINAQTASLSNMEFKVSPWKVFSVGCGTRTTIKLKIYIWEKNPITKEDRKFSSQHS